MNYQSRNQPTQPARLLKAETKPYTRPPQSQEPKPPQRFPQRFPREILDGLIGQRIVVQERGSKIGAPIIIGRLTAIDNYLLRLDESEIRGIRNSVKPPFVIVNIGNVSHLHPETEVIALEPAEVA